MTVSKWTPAVADLANSHRQSAGNIQQGHDDIKGHINAIVQAGEGSAYSTSLAQVGPQACQAVADCGNAVASQGTGTNNGYEAMMEQDKNIANSLQ